MVYLRRVSRRPTHRSAYLCIPMVTHHMTAMLTRRFLSCLIHRPHRLAHTRTKRSVCKRRSRAEDVIGGTKVPSIQTGYQAATRRPHSLRTPSCPFPYQILLHSWDHHLILLRRQERTLVGSINHRLLCPLPRVSRVCPTMDALVGFESS
jgi:hypothetical protein